MDGCAPNDPNRLGTAEELSSFLRTVGFLSLFANAIRGFSVEEYVPAAHWWTGEEQDPWMWRHILAFCMGDNRAGSVDSRRSEVGVVPAEAIKGKVLPASEVPDETVKTDLQMRTYLITMNFAQKQTKRGKPYGMPCSQLATPETKWGYGFVTSQYSSSAEACWERIEGHVLSLYPSADGKAIRSLLAMRMLTHASTTAR